MLHSPESCACSCYKALFQLDSVFLLQVHAREELTTVIDGEALVDDGIAAVLYAMFLVSLQHLPKCYRHSTDFDSCARCWDAFDLQQLNGMLLLQCLASPTPSGHATDLALSNTAHWVLPTTVSSPLSELCSAIQLAEAQLHADSAMHIAVHPVVFPAGIRDTIQAQSATLHSVCDRQQLLPSLLPCYTALHYTAL